MRLARSKLVAALITALALSGAPAAAWGPDGHQTVGAIADRIIAGTNAEKQVQAILGGLTLEDASDWADCAKGVEPTQNYNYLAEGDYPACARFETANGETEMEDFVKRNHQNCQLSEGEKSCHNEYHYADVAIQRGKYDSKYHGTRPDDVVHAVGAAVKVLQGGAAPAPFNFKGKREALMLLAHYVGDLHQPLHVGAIYLDAAGNVVDPDRGTFDARSGTRGGNSLTLPSANMHGTWDGVPPKVNPEKVGGLVRAAKRVPAPRGKVETWPAVWAGESIGDAKRAFQGVTFAPQKNDKWKVTLPAGYATTMNATKEGEIVKAGARLAQILRSIWP
jgi:hypothetical protein